jgi:hypothetical protein
MGRVRQYIEIDGRKAWTLFDTGARNTCVVPEVAALLATSRLDQPVRTALGGGVKESTQAALLDAKVEGYRISTHAMVLDKIGNDEDGNPIEVLFGALAMQQWGIRPVPHQDTLDMTHYPTEFVEFSFAPPPFRLAHQTGYCLLNVKVHHAPAQTSRAAPG